MYLFFDTETTGVPAGAPHVHLVQLAWLLVDDTGEERARADFIIKPEGFRIPDEVAKIHGISQGHALTCGLSLESVLWLFASAANFATRLVGHNIDFDDGVLAAEFKRLGWPNPLDGKERFCTMKTKSVVAFCALAGPNGFKWPKLAELHRVLFGNDFENAHNAKADIGATAKCFWKLRKLGRI